MKKTLHTIGRLKAWFQKTTRSTWFKKAKPFLIIGAILICVLLILPGITHAAHPGHQDPAPESSEELEGVYNRIISVIVIIMQFLQRLLWPLLLLIGGLLKNDILFNAGMEETMLSIWVNIRNLVNILFILVLLGIAFYNIMGGDAQDYHIKVILPRFIIALIAVNFSFLLGKVAIDGVSVLTTAIFALPGAVQRDIAEGGPEGIQYLNLEKTVCTEVYGGETEYEQNIQKAKKDNGQPFCTDKFNGKKFTDIGKQYFAKFDAHNAAIVMAVNLADIGNLDTLKGGIDPTLKGIAINVIFSMVLYIVYATAFIALFIILLIRLVVLWTGLVLSPLVVLKFVLPESIANSLGGDIQQKFIKTAIAPIPIALVMSIGFIMLQAFKAAKFGVDGTDLLSGSTVSINLLTSGLDTLQDLISAVGMVAFIWLGVFEAANGTYAQEITESIKGIGTSAGKFVASAPFKYLPLIPVAGGKPGKDGKVPKYSLGSVAGAIGGIPGAMESESRKKSGELLGSWGFGDQSVRENIKKAKTKEELHGAANTADALRDKGNQQEYGAKLHANAEWARELKSFLKLKEGDKAKSFDEFLKELRDGNVKPEVIEQFVKQMNTRYGTGTAPAPTDKTKPDTGDGSQTPDTTAGGVNGTAVEDEAHKTRDMFIREAAEKAGQDDAVGLEAKLKERQEKLIKIIQDNGGDKLTPADLEKEANKIIKAEYENANQSLNGGTPIKDSLKQNATVAKIFGPATAAAAPAVPAGANPSPVASVAPGAPAAPAAPPAAPASPANPTGTPPPSPPSAPTPP